MANPQIDLKYEFCQKIEKSEANLVLCDCEVNGQVMNCFVDIETAIVYDQRYLMPFTTVRKKFGFFETVPAQNKTAFLCNVPSYFYI
jgi:hypothetical protein